MLAARDTGAAAGRGQAVRGVKQYAKEIAKMHHAWPHVTKHAFFALLA